MLDFILKYWIQFLFVSVTTLLAAGYRKLSTKVKKQVQKQDAVEMGMQALLRTHIIQGYNQSKEKGYCHIYEMENVQGMYNAYHALGGNGTITELVERLKDMPTEPNNDKTSI